MRLARVAWFSALATSGVHVYESELPIGTTTSCLKLVHHLALQMDLPEKLGVALSRARVSSEAKVYRSRLSEALRLQRVGISLRARLGQFATRGCGGSRFVGGYSRSRRYIRFRQWPTTSTRDAMWIVCVGDDRG